MYKKVYFSMLPALLVLFLLLVACGGMTVPSESTTSEPAIKTIILATTTSTQDSGLLDELIPIFEEQTGYLVQTVAVGTGQALEMGEQGNADVLFVHAPSSEVTFMENGFGSARRLVMHNDFVVAGPESDPAGVTGSSSAAEAFARIAEAQALFVSRGDDSGTHKKELSLWQEAGITPAGAWYEESGQSMGATLRIASEKDAYTLADRATYLANKETLALVVLLEGDPNLLNVYHVIIVNPEMWPAVNNAGAIAFADFLTSSEGQTLIGQFGVDQYGQQLFFPDADKTDADLALP